MTADNAYSSQSYFDREQRSLFRQNWVCAGFGHQVPNPGDIAPVTVGAMPLILVRQRNGDVAVFHNVCRHRGSKLFTAPCERVRLITCPYHSWTYGLDGALRQRPHFDGPDHHSQDGDGLWPVDSAIWCDAVFVNLDGSAGPFEDFIAPLKSLGAAFGVEESRFDEAIEIEIAANWKLLVENFVDGYHVSTVHPALEKSVPTRTHTFRQEGSFFIGEAPRKRFEEGTGGGSYVSGLPEFEGVSEVYRDRLVYISGFPNLCINMVSDRLSLYFMQPVSPDQSREVICNYYAPGAFTDDTAEIRQRMTRNQLSFNAEDIDALERLQSGRSSDIYDNGCPSPYWDTNAEGFLAMCRDAIG